MLHTLCNQLKTLRSSTIGFEKIASVNSLHLYIQWNDENSWFAFHQILFFTSICFQLWWITTIILRNRNETSSVPELYFPACSACHWLSTWRWLIIFSSLLLSFQVDRPWCSGSLLQKLSICTPLPQCQWHSCTLLCQVSLWGKLQWKRARYKAMTSNSRSKKKVSIRDDCFPRQLCDPLCMHLLGIQRRRSPRGSWIMEPHKTATRDRSAISLSSYAYGHVQCVREAEERFFLRNFCLRIGFELPSSKFVYQTSKWISEKNFIFLSQSDCLVN